QRPGGRWVIAAQAGAEVMEWRAIWIELHVEAGVKLLLSRQESAVQLRTAALSTGMSHEQGVFTNAARRPILWKTQTLLTHVLPTLLQRLERRFLEVLDEDNRRILFDTQIAGVFGGQARRLLDRRRRCHCDGNPQFGKLLASCPFDP